MFSATAAAVEQSHRQHSQNKALFSRVPDAVIRDPKLSAAGLVAVAIRALYADDRSKCSITGGMLKNCKHVRQGFGKHSRDHAVAELKRLKFLSRTQPVPDQRKGRYYAKISYDELTLPGGNYLEVPARVLNGTLSVNELAAFMFVSGGTGKGPEVYRRELQVRFEWGEERAQGVLKALVTKKLIFPLNPRTGGGRFGGIRYTADPTAASTGTPETRARFDRSAGEPEPRSAGAPVSGAPSNTKDPLNVNPLYADTLDAVAANAATGADAPRGASLKQEAKAAETAEIDAKPQATTGANAEVHAAPAEPAGTLADEAVEFVDNDDIPVDASAISRNAADGNDVPPFLRDDDLRPTDADMRKTLWGDGLSYLRQAYNGSMSEKELRARLGRLAKGRSASHVVAAINAAKSQHPVDPFTYVQGVLNKPPGFSRGPHGRREVNIDAI